LASQSRFRKPAAGCWLLAVSLVFCGGLASAGAAPPQEVLSYRIEHETWGDIGRFSNSIRREDGRTLVEARLRIEVAVLFGALVLYREEADREESWENGRLASYRSRTDVDGDVIEISGQAEDDSFVIRRPDGAVTAPPGVFPTNLWSIDMKDAESVMGTKSGVVVEVRVEAGGRRRVAIGDQEIDARYFKIEPRSEPGVVPFPQEGWFDDADIPVRFAVMKDGKRVVFEMTNYRDVLAGRSGGP
jgi:hypothetical protein